MLDFVVKQVEGLGENLAYAGCYVNVENNLVDVITPLTQTSFESAIKIPSKGKLQLIIKNMREGDKLISSVSLPISLLKSCTYWLPLFDSLDYDYLSSLPEKVDYPRIQIQISDNSYECSSNFIDKIKSLQLKIIDLEHTLESERWEFQKEIGSLSSSQRYREDSQSFIIDQLKLQIDKQEKVIQDLLSQKNDYKNFAENDYKWKRELEDRLKFISIEYEKMLKKGQEQEGNYLNIIDNINREKLELMFKNTCQQQDLYEKDLTISHLKEKINHSSSESCDKMLGFLKNKVAIYQECLKDADKNRDALQKKIQDIFEKDDNMKSCLNCACKDKEISELTKKFSLLKTEIHELETKEQKLNTSTLESESYKETQMTSDLSSKIKQLMLQNKYLKSQIGKFSSKDTDEVDDLLKQYPDTFTKISPGQYIYNNFKVNIFIEKSHLLCRVGNVMTVNEFLISFTHSSNSTTPCDISFKETIKTCPGIDLETRECCCINEVEKKDEGKKKDLKSRNVLLRKQFMPEKKSFVPLRQSSSHFDRKKDKK